MAKEITMPKMGYDMEEGTLAAWLKQPGDSVKRGEPIAEIETDKVTIEVEAFESGTLKELLVKEGETVPVGAAIALIDDGSDDDDDDEESAAAATAAPEPASEPTQAEAQERPQAAAQSSTAQPQQRETPQTNQGSERQNGDRIIATPAARRVAQDRGVELATLQGSGPGGRIVRADVEGAQAGRTAAQPADQHATTPAATPPPAAQREYERAPQAAPEPAAPVIAAEGATEQPLSRLRQTIAKRMVASQQQVPPFFVTSTIEMDAALDLLPKLQAAHGGRLSVTELLLKACAKALLAYPELNASFAEDKLIMHPQVHISVAVATDAGLLAPVVRNVDTQSLGAISTAMRDVIKRTRDNKATLDDLQGGTFTVSNLGMFDVTHFVAIITPPQAAILAVGSTIPTPVVRDGEIVIRNLMNVTLSVDHRVSDGATAAKFLQELRQLMQEPFKLLL